MRALHLADSLTLRHDYPEPTVPPGESLLRVRLSGLCNTDLELVRGYMAFRGVLGHEFVGTVEQSDDPTLLGQRVVGEINATCGACAACQRGDATHCARRSVLGILGRDGCHAEWVTLPTRNLHRVPDSVSDEQALFTEPLAAACAIVEQHHLRPTQRVVVLGDGKLGLLVAQVLALTGCDLRLIGRHEAKLALLAGRATTEAVPRGAQSRLPDGWADVVVDCTGSAAGFASARRLVRPRGTLVLKSTYHGALEVNASLLVVDEIQLLGSRCGPFAPALRLLAAGLVQVEPMIHARYRLADALVALDHAARPGTLKVLLEP